MKKIALTETTRATILDTAWKLITERGTADVSLTEIAEAAGITRQTIYLGFGNRAGLLIAMARHADAASLHTRRMAEISEGDGASAETLLEFVDAWLSHLPEIYPVGVLLSAAAVTDTDVAAVFTDRMVGALHAKYLRILSRMDQAGLLPLVLPPTAAADLCWSLTHVDAWKHLVVERGWFAEAFRENRKALIRNFVCSSG